MATVRKSIDLKSFPELTDDEHAELARLDRMSDDAIDYSDIAELDASFWRPHAAPEAPEAGVDEAEPRSAAAGFNFVIYQSRTGTYAVQFLRGQEVIFETSGFASVSQARGAIELIKTHAPNMPTRLVG